MIAAFDFIMQDGRHRQATRKPEQLIMLSPQIEANFQKIVFSRVDTIDFVTRITNANRFDFSAFDNRDYLSPTAEDENRTTRMR